MANSGNNASEDQEANFMSKILHGMGIENGSVADFRSNELEIPHFTADNILKRLEDVAEELKQSRLEKSRLEKSQLEESQLEESQLEKSQLEESQLEKSQLEKSQLEKSQLEESRLEESQLKQLQLALETLFAPKGPKSKSRRKIRELFIKAIDKWMTKKENDGATYGKSWEGCLIKALCNVEEHFSIFSNIYDDESLPPFHHAAAKGDNDTIQAMILTHEQQSDGDRDVIIRGLDMPYKNETAFELATKHMRDNVVQLLYANYPTLAKSVRSTKSSCIDHFIKATSDLEKQDDKTDEKKIKLRKALDIFDIIIRDADASAWLPDVWEKAVEEKALKILSHLMEKKVDSSFITYDRASFIIEEGTYEMWQLLDDETLEKFFVEETCCLLHDAVSSGKCKIVENILQRFPEKIKTCIVYKKGRPKYALELLAGHKLLLDNIESYNTLRNLLVHSMIRSDLAIREIKDIGEISGVEVQSMALHFSNIDTTSQSFAEYIKSLKQHKPDYMRFEAVLKYASFPDLEKNNIFSQGSSEKVFGTDHSEICDAVSWLKERKVTEILELVVSDRLHSPHRDDQVIKCVNNLHVRILDWKKPDLYLPGLDTAHIQKLTLYSSGNQSVIDQWCNELPKFNQLKQLDIFIIKDLVRGERVKITEKSLKSLKNNEKLLELKTEITINSCQWFSSSEKMAVYRNIRDITLDVAGIELQAFIDKFKTHYRKKEEEMSSTPRIRIALVDSGVVAVSRQSSDDPRQPETQIDISRRIADGVSFVSKGNQEFLWWHASEPHGTQMATIICAINPCCDLYIAKVAETKTSSLSATNVTKAIYWAIQKKVDIISLSLVVYAKLSNDGEQSEQSAELMKAIKEAKSHDITIICSTADEGYSSVQDILNKRENKDKVVSIAACSEQGKPLEQSQEDAFIYRFSGNKIQLGSVPFLNSESHVTGSSVATAIAAATASLILSCCHISENFKTPGPGTRWKRDTVIETFHQMSDDATSERLGPWVRLHHLCGRNKLKEKFDFMNLVNEAYHRGTPAPTTLEGRSS